MGDASLGDDQVAGEPPYPGALRFVGEEFAADLGDLFRTAHLEAGARLLRHGDFGPDGRRFRAEQNGLAVR